MNILSAHQVKTRLTENPEVKLVMVLGTEAYNRSHIPGSLDLANVDLAQRTLAKDAEIIVYCSDVSCPASVQAYLELEREGYTNIFRFAGGLLEWETSGYSLVEHSE